MTHLLVSVTLALLFFVLRALGTPVSSTVKGKAQPRCVASTFERILSPGAVLEAVAVVPEGGTYGEGAANVAYPVNPTGLPALCAVTVRVASSRVSSYRFGLFLPAAWQGRFVAVGNGGFAGGINWLDMAPGPHYGFASLSTDTGHNSTSTDLSWAYRNPEGRTDWGWRALHGSAVLGKRLVEAYYGPGRRIAYSYYSGCSTGGRQGLREVQQFPDTFDGLLIGAPAWYTSHENTYVTKLGAYNLPVGDPRHIPATLFPALGAEVVRQCDAADGVADGIVSAPEACAFDFARIRCGGAGVDPRACLTDPQIATARKVYEDYYAADGRTWLYSGLSLSSEDQWWILLGGDEPSAFGVGYARYFLFDDPTWDWRRYTDEVVRYAERTDPGGATAARYDVSAFARRGGKMLLYHGVADGLVSTRGSTYYYNRTVEALGGSLARTRDFFRYFLIPGMQHCAGTTVDAPWNVAAAFQAGAMGTGLWSVPGFEDERHDALLALRAWVERGRPVDQLVATTWRSSLDPTSGVLRQRPLCPYPETAVYDGVGDVNSAKSWRCR